MNVLVVHNFYRKPGGEDEVFYAETNELKRQGVNIVTYTVHNDEITRSIGAVKAALHTVWHPAAAHKIKKLVQENRINIVHFHNTFPLISPAAYHAAKAGGAAVVQTLHNYRLLCAAGTLYRAGGLCTECINKLLPWPAVVHRCYQDSHAASGIVAAMQSTHRALGTYNRAVDVYIALTEEMRTTFINSGWAANKLIVKPNFLPQDPGIGEEKGPYALFVGRLTAEKGIRTLLEAWRTLHKELPLKVAGDGPLLDEAKRVSQQLPGIEVLGWQTREQVIALMKKARLLIFPSQWREPFGLTLIEAFATGLPVLASSSTTLVENGKTGRHFKAGDPQDLVKQARWLINHPIDKMRFSEKARATYLLKYAAESNISMLKDIYRQAQIYSRSSL